MLPVDKSDGLIPFVLTQILDNCVNGVTLSDPDLPDNPIVYANKAFEQISGYGQDEILGRNCRFLHRENCDQEALDTIRQAMKQHAACTVTLLNYRKTGEPFHNRLSIRPLVDQAGEVIYYLGVQYDVTDKVMAQARIDELTLELEMRNIS